MEQSNITVFEKIVLVFFLSIAMAPLITIPFILMVFYLPRWKMGEFKLKKNWVIISLFGLIIAITITILVLGSYYIPQLDPRYYESKLFPTSLWNSIQTNQLYLYSIFILDGQQCLILFILSYILLSARNLANISANMKIQSGWELWQNALRWKGLENGYPSGEKTLYKLKMASLFGFFSIAIVGIISPFIIGEFDIPFIFDRISTNQFGLTTDQYIAAGAWAGIGGFSYIVSHVMMWYLLGRIITNFANTHMKVKPVMVSERIIFWLIRIVGWCCSFTVFIPFLGTFFTHDFSFGYWIFGGIIVVGILAFGGIMSYILSDPLQRKIDLFALPHTDNPLHSQLRIQRAGLAILTVSTIFISIINGWLWFGALQIYAATVVWYESGFYLFFGLFITLCPILLLFYLDSIYGRRLLLGYYFIIFIIIIQLFLRIIVLDIDLHYLVLSFIFGLRVGRTKYYDIIPSSEYPVHIISVYVVFSLILLCIIIIRNGAIPIPVRKKSWQKWHLFNTIKEFIRQGPDFGDEFQNIKRLKYQFITFGILGILILSGMNLTLLQEDTIITLERPANHNMRVSFWAGGLNLPNETLQTFKEYDIRLFGWFDVYDVVNAKRYAEYGIEVIPVIHFPGRADEWQEQTQNRATKIMDFWDANGLQNTPFMGFAFDIEKWKFITDVDTDNYMQLKAHMRNFTEYVVSRNYSVYFTNYMMNIGDLYDGDEDVSILNLDPADYELDLGNGHFDWMIYRMEAAISYNEPHEYFTYQWGTQIKQYMEFLGGKELFAKASMSLGVTTAQLPLYTGKNGLQEFLKDMTIAHALGFPNVIIFVLSGFLKLWGVEGIVEMMEHLKTYDNIEIPYKRRASFMGNLKMEQNPTGSVFGFIYQDVWLESEFYWLFLITSPFLLIIPVIVTIYPLKGKKAINQNELDLNQKKGTQNKQQIEGEDLKLMKMIGVVFYFAFTIFLGQMGYIFLWKLI